MWACRVLVHVKAMGNVLVQTITIISPICNDFVFQSRQEPGQGTDIWNFGAPSPLVFLNFLQWIFSGFSRFSVQFSKDIAPKCGENCPIHSGAEKKAQNPVTSLAVLFFFRSWKKHPSRDVVFSGTSHDILEPLKQALLASCDVTIPGQICGSKLQRVFTLGDGCWLPKNGSARVSRVHISLRRGFGSAGSHLGPNLVRTPKSCNDVVRYVASFRPYRSANRELRGWQRRGCRDRCLQKTHKPRIRGKDSAQTVSSWGAKPWMQTVNLAFSAS